MAKKSYGSPDLCLEELLSIKDMFSHIQEYAHNAANIDPIVLNDMLSAGSLQLEKSIQKEKKRQIAEENGIQRDPLTGLYQKAAEKLFSHYIKEIYTSEHKPKDPLKAHSISLLVLDIDDFRKFNTIYGHSQGDEVLAAVSERCVTSTKSYDKVLRNIEKVTREGGEEFTIILPFTTPEQAYKVGERLVRKVSEQPITTDKGSYSVSISIGASSANFDSSLAQTADDHEIKTLYKTLFDQADDALYDAKLKGKNQIQKFDPQHDYSQVRKQYHNSMKR